MVKQELLSPEFLPTTESENRNVAIESFELASADISIRAATTTVLLQEILAQAEERRYAQHWGINE